MGCVDLLVEYIVSEARCLETRCLETRCLERHIQCVVLKSHRIRLSINIGFEAATK